MKPFLQSLREEIRVIGEWINCLGLQTENLYWGGGTPAFSRKDVGSGGVCLRCRGNIVSTSTAKEITVEAGDRIRCPFQIETFEAWGTNRICINPDHAGGYLAIDRPRHGRAVFGCR
jgi:coproporphyrinogen III oxidase-like Fe-S oxidoreductase